MVFEGLSFGEKYGFDKKIADTSFKQYFQDTVNPLCSRSLEAESTSHFFLRCQNFTNLCKCLVK